MDKAQHAISRGARAKALLEDDLLTGALARMETDYITAWRHTSARDTDARERLWQAVQVVAKIKDHLGMVLADGKIAQAELDALQAREKAA